MKNKNLNSTYFFFFQPLTDSELALLIISIVCYAFCFAYCIVKAAIILHYRLHKQLNFAVLLLLGALCLGTLINITL